METCGKCGAGISADETGLTRKLVNRGATSFLCLDCLAAAFSTTRERLEEMADRFRAAGCTMFPPKKAVRET